MTSPELNDAYRINVYGAMLEIEQAVETLREGIEEDNAEAREHALAFFDDMVPTLKTAIRARYSGDTEWIPFNTTTTDTGSVWVFEYDSDNSQRVRRREVALDDIPTEAELTD